MRSEIVQSVQ